MNKLSCISISALISLSSFNVSAANILWTDWTAFTSGTSSATGQINAGSGTVGVEITSTSNLNFVQTGTGTDYWTGSAYTGGVADNAPTAAEMISLNTGGTVTITFSETVIDPLIGLVSWNGNVADFGTPITIDSFGTGFWGTGTPVLNGAGTGFNGVGEVHGTILLRGAFDSISFTHTSENWHGFTVGVAGVSAVPVPAAAWLFGSGLVALIGFARRKV